MNNTLKSLSTFIKGKIEQEVGMADEQLQASETTAAE